MSFTLAQQGWSLFLSLFLGIVFELVYEIIRVLRLIFPGKIKTFVFDFIFMLLFSFSTTIFSMAYSDGSVRYFTLFGILSAFFLAKQTLGRVIRRIIDKAEMFFVKIIKIVTKIGAKNAKKVLKLIGKI